MVERWRPVHGFWNYEVSDFGRVRSLSRVVVRRHRNGENVYQLRAGVVLRPGKTEDGYPIVVLCDHGHRETRRIHLLVLEAFRGPRPGRFQGLHNDGVPSNCRLENLRWGSAASNTADALRMGTHFIAKGSAHGCAKLSEEQAREILGARGGYRQIRGLAQRYGVSVGTVHSIRSRKSWKHLEGTPCG